jgi:hypothetical protein
MKRKDLRLTILTHIIRNHGDCFPDEGQKVTPKEIYWVECKGCPISRKKCKSIIDKANDLYPLVGTNYTARNIKKRDEYIKIKTVTLAKQIKLKELIKVIND